MSAGSSCCGIVVSNDAVFLKRGFGVSVLRHPEIAIELIRQTANREYKEFFKLLCMTFSFSVVDCLITSNYQAMGCSKSISGYTPHYHRAKQNRHW
jgi:hypothetical protein